MLVTQSSLHGHLISELGFKLGSTPKAMVLHTVSLNIIQIEIY